VDICRSANTKPHSYHRLACNNPRTPCAQGFGAVADCESFDFPNLRKIYATKLVNFLIKRCKVLQLIFPYQWIPARFWCVEPVLVLIFGAFARWLGE
jgi:hypothetical protein